MAWILGLGKDLGSALPLGFHALLFAGVAWGILRFRKLIFREHPLMQCGIVFGAVLAVNLLVAGFVCVFTGGVPFKIIAVKTLTGAVFSGVLAPVVMALLLRWRSFLRAHG